MLIFRRFELKNQLAGRFSDDMKGDYRFTCLTGNCQMALCWTLLAARNGDPRLLNAAIKAVSLVAKKAEAPYPRQESARSNSRICPNMGPLPDVAIS